jgi:hypothetical protein
MIGPRVILNVVVKRKINNTHVINQSLDHFIVSSTTIWNISECLVKSWKWTWKFPAAEGFNTRHSFILVVTEPFIKIAKTQFYAILWLELHYSTMSHLVYHNNMTSLLKWINWMYIVENMSSHLFIGPYFNPRSKKHRSYNELCSHFDFHRVWHHGSILS